MIVDAAIDAARLPRGDRWSVEVEGSPFADRAVSGPDLARTLGLDCGAQAEQAGLVGSRFVIVSWTGPRMAYVVLADDQPDVPYRSDATVTILTEDLSGEFIGESQALYAARLESGPTILIGHEDYNLAATAKSWQVAVPPPPDGETTLESERHAIDALRAAGARNVSVAQPPEFGSDEGYVQFITPQGQIGVADVAPASSLDPMLPRYLDGATTVERVDGVDLRTTEPGPDAPPWAGVIEVGFRCGEWSWILEPPGNGSGPELVAFARELISRSDCLVSGAG